jgi:hypothetical protein
VVSIGNDAIANVVAPDFDTIEIGWTEFADTLKFDKKKVEEETRNFSFGLPLPPQLLGDYKVHESLCLVPVSEPPDSLHGCRNLSSSCSGGLGNFLDRGASILTWNCRGLLVRKPKIRKKKLAALASFSRHADVVSLQEVHGNIVQLTEALGHLRNRFHIFGSIPNRRDRGW